MSSLWKPKLETLPPQQRNLWIELVGIPTEFVLYGGTALTLQLGHRQSIDFDFFGFKELDHDQILRAVPSFQDAVIVQQHPNTLTLNVNRGGSVQVSFFGVPELKRISLPHVDPDTGLRVATLLDLAGTKAAVVQKRAEAKDYIDIDALIHKGGVSLPEALSAARLIYGSRFNPELTLKALCYFGDGNLRTIADDVQQRLVAAVKAVELERLPTIASGDLQRKPEKNE